MSGKFLGGKDFQIHKLLVDIGFLADVMDLLTHFDKKALEIAFSKVSPSLGRSGLVPATKYLEMVKHGRSYCQPKQCIVIGNPLKLP